MLRSRRPGCRSRRLGSESMNQTSGKDLLRRDTAAGRPRPDRGDLGFWDGPARWDRRQPCRADDWAGAGCLPRAGAMGRQRLSVDSGGTDSRQRGAGRPDRAPPGVCRGCRRLCRRLPCLCARAGPHPTDPGPRRPRRRRCVADPGRPRGDPGELCAGAPGRGDRDLGRSVGNCDRAGPFCRRLSARSRGLAVDLRDQSAVGGGRAGADAAVRPGEPRSAGQRQARLGGRGLDGRGAGRLDLGADRGRGGDRSGDDRPLRGRPGPLGCLHCV